MSPGAPEPAPQGSPAGPSFPIAAIGGAAGAAALLVVGLGVGLWWYRRNAKRRLQLESFDSLADTSRSIETFGMEKEIDEGAGKDGAKAIDGKN